MREVRISDDIRCEVPIEAVWSAILDPVAHARWHPFVTEISGRHALDEIRTCSVLIGKTQGQTRERCVEYHDRRKITWAIEEDSSNFSQMVSDWRAGFALAAQGQATRVTAESVFRPNNLLVRAMLPMIRRKFHHAQRAILRGLQDSATSAPLHLDRSAFGP
jgi:hypothetical protein